MTRSKFLAFLFCILASFCDTYFINLTYGADNAPLVLGVFPRRNATTTTKMFKPITEYLSNKLGRQVKLETAKDFPTFWRYVQEKRYDIVQYNQLHYVRSHHDFGYSVIAMNEEFGKRTIEPAIVVRRDSGLKNLTDLRGKKIVFGGGKLAMVAYVGNTVLLRRAGLKKGDYIEEFAKNPPNAAFATYYKQADAGGTGNIALVVPVVQKKIDTSQLTFLALGEAMPHLPWAVKGDMNNALKIAIQDNLIALNRSPAGKTILRKAGLTGIRLATDHDYDICRHLVDELKTSNAQKTQ